MKLLSRRGLLGRAWTPLLLASPLALAPHAAAETAQYLYDPLGRLVRVTLSDGTIIVYDYDAAGNRTRMVRSDGSAFNATLQVTGSGPVNLRTIADQAGYTGATNATITFQVGAAVAISGAIGAPNGGIGIDTGTWPSSAHTIALALQVSGKIYGGGGRGGSPTTMGGTTPGAGGDAVYCRENISITVNAGGQIKAGGGGGGSGGSWRRDMQDAEGEPLTIYSYGGGGGGGFPNGPGGPSEGPGGGGAGSNGSSGGTGGAGASIGGGRVTGAGGAGGPAGASGAGGAVATGSEGCNLSGTTCDYEIPGGFANAAGYAIRKNGKTVTVTNNGTIVGAQG